MRVLRLRFAPGSLILHSGSRYLVRDRESSPSAACIRENWRLWIWPNVWEDNLLIDDQRGKLEAIRRGLPVGTVGVLYKAALAGIVDFEQQLNVLLQTNFHLSDTLRLRYLELWRVSKSRGSRR
jgi:hypothetical protein